MWCLIVLYSAVTFFKMKLWELQPVQVQPWRLTEVWWRCWRRLTLLTSSLALLHQTTRNITQLDTNKTSLAQFGPFPTLPIVKTQPNTSCARSRRTQQNVPRAFPKINVYFVISVYRDPVFVCKHAVDENSRNETAAGAPLCLDRTPVCTNRGRSSVCRLLSKILFPKSFPQRVAAAASRAPAPNAFWTRKRNSPVKQITTRPMARQSEREFVSNADKLVFFWEILLKNQKHNSGLCWQYSTLKRKNDTN